MNHQARRRAVAAHPSRQLSDGDSPLNEPYFCRPGKALNSLLHLLLLATFVAIVLSEHIELSTAILKNSLRKYRKQKFASQQAFADAVGKSFQLVSAYETGRQIPSADFMEKASQVLGVSKEVLLAPPEELLLEENAETCLRENPPRIQTNPDYTLLTDAMLEELVAHLADELKSADGEAAEKLLQHIGTLKKEKARRNK